MIFRAWLRTGLFQRKLIEFEARLENFYFYLKQPNPTQPRDKFFFFLFFLFQGHQGYPLTVDAETKQDMDVDELIFLKPIPKHST